MHPVDLEQLSYHSWLEEKVRCNERHGDGGTGIMTDHCNRSTVGAKPWPGVAAEGGVGRSQGAATGGCRSRG